MYLAKRLLLLALAGISLLVALFGLFRFLVEVGQSPLRYVVQDAGVFAAGLMGMFLCWRGGRKLKLAHDAVLDAARQFTGDVLEASASAIKQVLALVFVGLSAVVSTLLYLQRPSDWVLGLCAAFFALLFVLLVPMLLSLRRGNGPTLRMDTHGLRHAWYGEVPWTDVHGIYLGIQTIRHSEVKRMVLGVSNPVRYLDRMPWVARLLSEQWRAPQGRYGTLVVPIEGLGQDPLRVFNAAEALRDRAAPDRLKYWHPSLDAESISLGLELEYLAANPDRLPAEEVLRRMEAIQPRMHAMTHQLRGRR